MAKRKAKPARSADAIRKDGLLDQLGEVLFIAEAQEATAKKVNKRVKRQDPDKAKRAKGKRKPPRELKVPAKKKGKK